MCQTKVRVHIWIKCFRLLSDSPGKLTVFSMKTMLATMCGGKIVDKLRCKFSFYYVTWRNGCGCL